MQDKHNSQSQLDIEAIRYDFGYRLMGPAIAEYLMKLNSTIELFDQVRNAKVLFVSRAGIRIRRALETYLTTIGKQLPESAGNFWVSRLMVTKGTWKRSRKNSIDTLAEEFSQAPVRDFIEAMYRNEGLPASFPVKKIGKKAAGNDIGLFFEQNGPAARTLASYFNEQSEFFETYLNDLLGGKKRVLLVDTGWAGTTQRLLADAFPDIDWWGAYFGRYGTSRTDRKYWRNMIGLVFAQDTYEHEKPETCTILHRHMIEDLFEPNGKSIERLVKTKTGKILAPESEEILADDANYKSDPIFTGVLEYLSKLPDGHTPSAIHKNARTAWKEISRIVTLPTRKETQIFSAIERSADFGKKLKVPLLLSTKPRNDGDTPEKRISAALWGPGQASIEYPREIAEPLQRKLTGLDRFAFKKSDKKVQKVTVEPRKWPCVAIITRTLDRPMFLERALESVAAQTFEDYVHVVVNDGGDADLVKKIINETNCAQHRIVLVDNVVNRGMEAASNIGIRSVNSDYIVIHDDDDSWEPEFLEKSVAFLRGQKIQTYGGVITKSTYVSEEITPDGIEIHTTTGYMDWVSNVHIMEMAIGNFYPPIAFLFRRDIYDKIGGYNEEYPVLGDWDFNLRYLLETDIGVIPERLAHYHHRDRGDTSLFGNSVIADRDYHMEYSAIVRNRFARNLLHADHPAMAMMVGIGLHFGANRNSIRALQSQAGGLPDLTVNSNDGDWSNSAFSGDDYWVAMYTYSQAVARRDWRVLRKIGKIGILGWRVWARRLGLMRGSSPITPQSVQFLTSLTKAHYGFEPSPDFDEEAYLNNNPDVAKAVKNKGFRSGYEHYYRHGRKEGRMRPTRVNG